MISAPPSANPICTSPTRKRGSNLPRLGLFTDSRQVRPSLTRRAWCEPQVWTAQSQTVRWSGYTLTTQSYPCGAVPVRKLLLEAPSGEPMQPASDRKGRRRRGQARAAREGSRFGRVGRPRSQACRSLAAEGLPSAPRSAFDGSTLRTDTVTGGLAWAQWLTTLTGESPTPSRRLPGKPGL